MWTRRENYFPIASKFIWSNDPSALKWGEWWAINNHFLWPVVNGLGSAFSEGDLGWSLSSCVWLLLLLEQLGPKWQMEDLQSKSLPWKVTSKGAHPQQDWGCRVVLLHAAALFVGKQRKGLDFQKYLDFLDFFFPPLKERLLFWSEIR